jgi:lipoprotein LpqH
VTIDGQPKTVDGPVVCATTDGKFSIASGDVITGVIVGLEPDASAIKDGNTYTVTGTASGSDSTGMQVSKPFEVVATCP